MTQKIKPPPTLDRRERAQFRRLCQQLIDAGIDAAERAPLASDFVAADARIGELREREAQARGKAKAAATRSLNVLTAERRRLHAALFAGARAVEPEPTEAEVAAADAQAEADRAWRAHYFGRKTMTPEQHDAQGKALRARHGEPRWNALLYRSPEDQAEGEAAIADFNRRHRQLPQ